MANTRIKDATLVEELTGNMMLAVGNTEDDTIPSAASVAQVKEYIDDDKSEVAFSGNYNDLSNLPNLNNYALLSTLTADYYEKSEVNALIGGVVGSKFMIVETLPSRGRSNIIYLVKDPNASQEDIFIEYLWIEDVRDYERVGSTRIDLSDYYTKTQVDAMIPTVNNARVTLTQGGVTKGSFTLNQNANVSIALEVGSSSTQVQTDWDESDVLSPSYIKNKPVIPVVNNPEIILMQNGVELGHFNLNQVNSETIHIDSFVQQQSDWTENDDESVSYIKNKPSIPTVNNPVITITQGGITKGSFSLNQSSSATISLDSGGGGSAVQSNWNETDNTSPAYIQNKPVIPAAQVNSDWNAVSGVSEILNKPSLATVATSGSYTDLSNKPSIPAAQVNSDWNSTSGISEILNKPTLATVATSGSYTDLSNKPTIPAAQVNSDWNSTSGISEILNKPSMTTSTLVFVDGNNNETTVIVYTQPNNA